MFTLADQVAIIMEATIDMLPSEARGAEKKAVDISEDPSASGDNLREQDRLLPVANVAHLIASELPTGAKVSRDAKLLCQEIVSEFICFITMEANDVCLHGKQKAITHADIRTALRNLGVHFFLLSCMHATPSANHATLPVLCMSRHQPTMSVPCAQIWSSLCHHLRLLQSTSRRLPEAETIIKAGR